MLMAALQAVVRHASGLEVSRQTAARAVRQRMTARAIDGLGMYLARLDGDGAELQALLELLVVPETWFFRDPEAFSAAAVAVADLMRQRGLHGTRTVTSVQASLPVQPVQPLQQMQPVRPVRLLSLPCATGEEPYSLVMALLDAGLPTSGFTVDAIDISGAVLSHARRAVYRQNAFRNPDLSFRDRHFTESDEGFALSPAVRNQVRFHNGNLMKMAPAPTGQRYDIIFCRNLLIYFDTPNQLQAIRALDELLDVDGLLFSGYAELPVFTANGFVTAHVRRAFALRKQAATPSMPSPTATAAAVSHKPARAMAPASSAPVPQAVQPTPPGASELRAADHVQGNATAALLAQAQILADRGELAAAAERLDVFLQAAPDSAPAYAMRGAVHAARGETTEAERCLRRALYLEPKQYDVVCQLAVLAERHGDAAGAQLLRERAARLQARRRTDSTAPTDSVGHAIRTARTDR